MKRIAALLASTAALLALTATPATAATPRLTETVRPHAVDGTARVRETGKPSRVYKPGAKLDPTADRTPAPAPTPAPTGRYYGAFVSGSPSSMQPVIDLETRVGEKASVVHFYISDGQGFPTSLVTKIKDHGSTPLVTWEFWSLNGVGVAPINNGSKDAYLRQFARDAKTYGGEVWLRPFHEMNGNWYPWCGTVNGNTPTTVIAAYKHVKDIFAAEGATNVKFVWSPNCESVPGTSANAIAKYWPGEAYVDRVGIDGYNFGTSYSYSTWRSFTTTFRASYDTVAALTATKPIFIAETACTPDGGNKAAWITDMFRVIPTSFPRIEGVVWFETNGSGVDFRISGSQASIDAFKAGLTTF